MKKRHEICQALKCQYLELNTKTPKKSFTLDVICNYSDLTWGEGSSMNLWTNVTHINCPYIDKVKVFRIGRFMKLKIIAEVLIVGISFQTMKTGFVTDIV